MLCVGGWLKPHAPVSSGICNVRLPRGWSERRRASVRSARGVLRVCVEGNSHSEAEVSINTRPGPNERPSSHVGCSLRRARRRGSVSEEETNAKSPEGAVTRSNKSKSIIDREGNTHEPTECQRPCAPCGE